MGLRREFAKRSAAVKLRFAPLILLFSLLIWVKDRGPSLTHRPAQSPSRPLDDNEHGRLVLILYSVCPNVPNIPQQMVKTVFSLGLNADRCESRYSSSQTINCEMPDCYSQLSSFVVEHVDVDDCVLFVGRALPLHAALSESGKHHVIIPRHSDFEQLTWFEALSMQEFKRWANVTFEINVVTTCRLQSLESLMVELSNSYYFGTALIFKLLWTQTLLKFALSF